MDGKIMMQHPKTGETRGSPSLERRLGIDRRGASRLSLRSLLWGGRREMIRRREDRQKWAYVDRYQQSLFGVIVIILFLSVVDAILTLLLIGHGAVEVNPVMAFYLDLGPYAFLAVKYALTSTGLVILVLFRGSFLKPIRMSAGAFLYVILAAFLGVVSWEIYLIHKVLA
jgi:hypothetical protein